jgi:hypothetical protein
VKSVVFGIVRQGAGTIWLYSEPGKGTSFKIYLPVAGLGSEKAPSLPLEPARLHGSETVLLLEDEEGVRKLVRSILQRKRRLGCSRFVRVSSCCICRGVPTYTAVLHGVLRSEAAFVQKPITPTALLSKVREVLDSP